MGSQKHGSKGVGGFLHLFDWNAKSRKKLFSSKSESPEQPKQTKRTNGNTPMTRYHMMSEDDMAHASSLKGSSDYSCATSVTDEDGYGSKAPSVVARLMGLDSLPTSNFSDTYSNPSFDSQSFKDFYIKKDQFQPNYHQNEPLKPPKMAIDKFQTEILPPKSAKSIPITRHKLLSPIKNARFVSSSNPACIMEAASKIPLVGPSSSSSSSSVPLKVRSSQPKVPEASRKPKVPEASRRPNLKGQQQPPEPKKSISLALQAKANVQKREGLNHRAQPVKTQLNNERNTHKTPTSSCVLKPNSQKQNMLVDRGKSTPKLSGSIINSQARKPVSKKCSSKINENMKTSHKKEPYSTTRRKRCIEDTDRNVIRDRNYRSNTSDVVSFTFTAPIARPVISNSGKNVLHASGNTSSSLSYNVIGSDALSTLLEQKLRELTCNHASVSQDSLTATENNIRDDSSYGFSSYGPLKLTAKQHTLDQDRDRITRDDSNYGFSSNDPLEIMKKHQKLDQGVEAVSESSSNDYEYRKLVSGRQPSPISVLEPSFLSESCNSSNTWDSCKQSSSSVQAQELMATPMDIDTELSDSASSTTMCHKWEADYVKQVLSDIETMFVDFTLGKTQKIVNPGVLDRLECGAPKQEVAKLRRELVFDCVSECVDRWCRVWTKGLAVVKRPERLGEQVYKEIGGWEEMKDCMVDELVDRDMSGGAYGKWLDFDVEALDIGVEMEGRLLDSLINEVVDDILLL